MQKTDTDLDKAKKILQDILLAGANEKGEWFLPLPPDQAAAMRQVSGKVFSYLDCVLCLHYSCRRSITLVAHCRGMLLIEVPLSDGVLLPWSCF